VSHELDTYDFRGFLGRRALLGVCGSIAAYKALEILRYLRAAQADVAATLTTAAEQFIAPLSFRSLGAEPVFSRLFAPDTDLYSHLYAGRNAHAFVVAPATANMVAKLAHGQADDMLSCQALSFPHPLIIAPAMNPLLWEAPATQENIAKLKARGHNVIDPGFGLMACGDVGQGRLADNSLIVLHALRALTPQDLAGKHALVTLGPTREYWDGVRFLSNPSSGRMGACLAVAAWLRGAAVRVVHGPISLTLPSFIERTPVTSAQEMLDACAPLWSSCDLCCFTAAVCDFAPTFLGPKKIKKMSTEQATSLALHTTPDLLLAFCAQKSPEQIAIGFAAETDSLTSNAREKLLRKGADLIVGNIVNRPDSGFETRTNQAYLLDKHGREEQLPVMPKSELAWRILDWLPLL
jgi:phosphopantothenoylcysteine decarboxylase/phosphopantothenate--cysteine ligase